MTLNELDDELKRLGLKLRRTSNGISLCGETSNAHPALIAALKEHKPRLLDLIPIEQMVCAGFRVSLGKRGIVHTPCNTIYWNRADCAVACINRHCPQRDTNEQNAA